MSLRTTDFKSHEIGVTWSYETIRTNIYGPSGRQGIASAGFVSTRTATILAPFSLTVRKPSKLAGLPFFDDVQRVTRPLQNTTSRTLASQLLLELIYEALSKYG